MWLHLTRHLLLLDSVQGASLFFVHSIKRANLKLISPRLVAAKIIQLTTVSLIRLLGDVISLLD